MEPKDDIREFLSTRRARITPQQAGLPVFGDTRRVPGLRREEAAMLAGVSVDYHPVVGDLSLTFDMLELAADPGLHLLALSAEPGSTSADALRLLGSWAATVDPATARATNDA